MRGAQDWKAEMSFSVMSLFGVVSPSCRTVHRATSSANAAWYSR
jgi:hypothetical protein